MRVLLVEDDPLLGDGIQTALTRAACTVDWARDGLAAISAIRASMHGAGSQQPRAVASSEFDVIVLDLGLPKADGLEVLKTVRQLKLATPVLILTARDSVQDRVRGLDLGADDYLGKPFDLNELMARLRALHRRQTGQATAVIEHGKLRMDLHANLVSYEGRVVELPRREFALLRVLLENVGRVLSREAVQDKLYGWNEEIESNTLEVHVHHLRRKFYPELIRTIRGVGYLVERPA